MEQNRSPQVRMEHEGDPNQWEFTLFSVPCHQHLHMAEQTGCGCLSCFKKRGEMGKCWISEREVVGSSPTCLSLTWCPWSEVGARGCGTGSS